MAARAAATPAARHTGKRDQRTCRIVPQARHRGFGGRSPGAARESGISLMGLDDSFSVDEAVEHTDRGAAGGGAATSGKRLHYHLAILLFAAAVYLGCIVSPPSLMDDVDA